MKIRSRGIQAIALIIAAVVLALVFHRAGEWLADELNQREALKTHQPAIGIVSQVEGRVLVKRFGDQRGQWVTTGRDLKLDLRSLDTVQVESRSSASIDLPNGYQLALEPNSLVVFELWNGAQSDSPIYAHVLQGALSAPKKGQRGKLFVLQNGELSYPEGTKIKKTRELIVRPQELKGEVQEPTPETAAVDATLSATTEGASAGVVPDLSAELADGQTEESHPGSEQTLSDEYLDQAIGSQREQFQKCQSNALREGQPAKGRLVVGLKVLPTGAIAEVHFLVNEVGNEVLEKCILDAFSRVKFRPFTGEAIARSYPLTLE